MDNIIKNVTQRVAKPTELFISQPRSVFLSAGLSLAIAGSLGLPVQSSLLPFVHSCCLSPENLTQFLPFAPGTRSQDMRFDERFILADGKNIDLRSSTMALLWEQAGIKEDIPGGLGWI